MDAITWYDQSVHGEFNPEVLIDNSQDNINQITINDFDGDGVLDIASISQGQNALNWFENLTYSAALNNTEFEKRNIVIYPNPTTNKLFFKGNFNETLTVTVYDILGKMVINSTVNLSNNELDVSRLNKGVYIISFKDFNSTFKFIKE